jgi:hypothetical protein
LEPDFPSKLFLLYNAPRFQARQETYCSYADRLNLTIVEEIKMKKLFSVAFIALFTANMAFAADAACEAKAAEKKLAGAAKNSFMTKCEKDAAAAAPAAASSCTDRAAEKKLAGAAKNAFMTKCEKDAAAAKAPSCESQAAEKKLAGAAKNSFVKKCTEGAASK